MQKIVVTGGAGYIGSHTVVELSKLGYNVIIIDNFCNSTIDNINGINKILNKNIKWYNIDCTNNEGMNDFFSNEKNIDAIIHFAAYKSVEESVREPEKYYKNNIGSLELILKCMKENNINHIIFSSSCTVYGMPDILPVSEKSIFKKAESPYGETKQICEQILEKDSSNSVSLRYFNPIGSHKSALIGDCSADKPNNLVPILTEVAIGKRSEITVFGDDYNTRDGTCIRDYIHVVDLAKSHIEAMKFLIKKGGKHAFNVGTGIGASVLEIIKIFEASNKLKINYKIGPRRDGDIEEIYANDDLIKSLLKWEAKENLQEAMISSLKWEINKNCLGKIK